MADGVARSPSRLCRRDGKICCYGGAFSTIFLLACFCALLPTFRFSFLFSFFSYCSPASRCVYLLCVPSSVQQPSATLSKYVFHSTCPFCLCHLYPTPSRNYLFFIRLVLFFVALTSRVTFFLLCSRTWYARTWSAYLESLAFGFSVSLSVTTEFLSL